MWRRTHPALTWGDYSCFAVICHNVINEWFWLDSHRGLLWCGRMRQMFPNVDCCEPLVIYVQTLWVGAQEGPRSSAVTQLAALIKELFKVSVNWSTCRVKLKVWKNMISSNKVQMKFPVWRQSAWCVLSRWPDKVQNITDASTQKSTQVRPLGGKLLFKNGLTFVGNFTTCRISADYSSIYRLAYASLPPHGTTCLEPFFSGLLLSFH